MPTLITNGIKISVETNYREDYSKPVQKKHVFSYLITIKNESRRTVQLLRRRWIILDSAGSVREVKGDGVVGEQPILHPGEEHEYTSWCDFESAIGKMRGFYQMQDMRSKKKFQVKVPEFLMVAPYKNN
ncbi:MAG: Co2+/Mg2+ efflux protein ApaG [Saprospiraceae bacterium]